MLRHEKEVRQGHCFSTLCIGSGSRAISKIGTSRGPALCTHAEHYRYAEVKAKGEGSQALRDAYDAVVSSTDHLRESFENIESMDSFQSARAASCRVYNHKIFWHLLLHRGLRRSPRYRDQSGISPLTSSTQPPWFPSSPVSNEPMPLSARIVLDNGFYAQQSNSS